MFLGIASSITWPLGISSLACLLRAIQVMEGSPTYLNHETSFCHMCELDYGTCAMPGHIGVSEARADGNAVRK